MKTGALLLFAVEAGARMGGADARQTAALSRYGAALGAAFQVADDILDAEGDEQALGKRAGKDADRNKATLVAALGIEEARKRRDALAQEAIQALDDGGFGDKAAHSRRSRAFHRRRENPDPMNTQPARRAAQAAADHCARGPACSSARCSASRSGWFFRRTGGR